MMMTMLRFAMAEDCRGSYSYSCFYFWYHAGRQGERSGSRGAGGWQREAANKAVKPCIRVEIGRDWVNKDSIVLSFLF